MKDETILSNFERNRQTILAGFNDQKLINQPVDAISEKQFDLIKGEFAVYSEEDVNRYISDIKLSVKDTIQKGDSELSSEALELIEKANKDLGKLVKKTVVDKRGHKMTVYIDPNKGSKNKEQTADGKALTTFAKIKASPDKVDEHKKTLHDLGKNHEEMSHINKIRFEREYEKHHGKKFDKETTYGGETKDVKTKKTTKSSPSTDEDEKDERGMSKKMQGYKTIGKTQSGKDINASVNDKIQFSADKHFNGFTKQDHLDAVKRHKELAKNPGMKGVDVTVEAKHNEKASKKHLSSAAWHQGEADKFMEKPKETKSKDKVKDDKVEKGEISDALGRYSSNRIEFKKKGKEIKEKLTSLVETLNAQKTSKATSIADLKKLITCCEPDREVSSYNYRGVKGVTSPYKLYDWCYTYFREDQPKMISYIPDAPEGEEIKQAGSKEEAANCDKYNDLVRDFVDIMVDIAVADMYIRNMEDNTSYTLNSDQMSTLGF
jgi:hypothetical protein